jgi:hypothetical protein
MIGPIFGKQVTTTNNHGPHPARIVVAKLQK